MIRDLTAPKECNTLVFDIFTNTGWNDCAGHTLKLYSDVSDIVIVLPLCDNSASYSYPLDKNSSILVRSIQSFRTTLNIHRTTVAFFLINLFDNVADC